MIGKKKDVDDSSHKIIIEHTLKCARLLVAIILDQSEKHQEASVTDD